MLSVSRPADRTPMAAPLTGPDRPIAHTTARISAYLVDTIVLLALILVFFVLGGAVLLLSAGESDPSDTALVTTIVIFSGGSLLTWTGLNLALMRWRGQTAGKYVVGIRVVAEDGSPPGLGRIAIRWFGLHPLLFHPLLLLPWTMLTLLSVDFAFRGGIIVVIGLAALAVLSPIVNAASLLLDPGRRALHDRLAGTIAVHMQQP